MQHWRPAIGWLLDVVWGWQLQCLDLHHNVLPQSQVQIVGLGALVPCQIRQHDGPLAVSTDQDTLFFKQDQAAQ
jgi:hypothetical protein